MARFGRCVTGSQELEVESPSARDIECYESLDGRKHCTLIKGTLEGSKRRRGNSSY